jgi:hypothetical protein
MMLFLTQHAKKCKQHKKTNDAQGKILVAGTEKRSKSLKCNEISITF